MSYNHKNLMSDDEEDVDYEKVNTPKKVLKTTHIEKRESQSDKKEMKNNLHTVTLIGKEEHDQGVEIEQAMQMQKEREMQEEREMQMKMQKEREMQMQEEREMQKEMQKEKEMQIQKEKEKSYYYDSDDNSNEVDYNLLDDNTKNFIVKCVYNMLYDKPIPHMMKSRKRQNKMEGIIMSNLNTICENFLKK